MLQIGHFNAGTLTELLAGEFDQSYASDPREKTFGGRVEVELADRSELR